MKINCLIVDDEPIAREVLMSHLEKLEHVVVKGTCASAFEAFSVLNTTTVDLIFLDINMPEMSGLSFAKSIDPAIDIIFTTAHREFALEGFEADAVDYLLKPISFQRLLKALNKHYKKRSSPVVIEKEGANSEPEAFFFVRSDRKNIKINFQDIVYLESFSDYVKIHTTEKVITTRELISQLEYSLPAQLFLRIHRSYMVAIKHIESYTHEIIEIDDLQLPISRSYKKSVMHRLESSTY